MGGAQRGFDGGWGRQAVKSASHIERGLLPRDWVGDVRVSVSGWEGAGWAELGWPGLGWAKLS